VCAKDGAIHLHDVSLARSDGTTPNEQYYKWQLVQGLIQSGLFPADCIGTELSVPRGSRGSTSLFIDVVLFADNSWIEIYNDLVGTKRPSRTWDELLSLIIGCGEIKDDRRDDPDTTIARQLVPALASASSAYTIGFYYNRGHLVVFSRSVDDAGVQLRRLDPVKEGAGSGVRALNTAVPDSYSQFPSQGLVLGRGSESRSQSREDRTVHDLDITSSRSQEVVKSALESITRTLDQVSMGSEQGYRIVVETLATKIFDEKRSDAQGRLLDFYMTAEERPVGGKRPTGAVKIFMDRMRSLHQDALATYPGILSSNAIVFSDPSHLRIVGEVVQSFQDISFMNSTLSDLYQVVFYNFAAPLSKAQQAQFVTPLQVIDFMVKLVGPRRGEDVCDPTMGVADFLAETFRYRSGLMQGDKTGENVAGEDPGGDDERLYGVDNDQNMRMLAALNMLLNGDGRATLIHEPDTGSLDHKMAINSATGTVHTVALDSTENALGAWDLGQGSGDTLKTFDVVLTNPPFGDQRALKLNDPVQGAKNKSIANLYEISQHVSGNQIDRGLLFLENAIQILKPGGRFAIILSTSLAGVKEYEAARRWLLSKVRLVAIFDLPPNIFAETGVPTTILVGYKATQEDLQALQQGPYELFTKKIERVGFFKATRKRAALLLPKYQIDQETGVVAHDPTSGTPILDQEFDEIIDDFDLWVKTQEPALQTAFSRVSASTRTPSS
jgi:type I restriction enzyme M protein